MSENTKKRNTSFEYIQEDEMHVSKTEDADPSSMRGYHYHNAYELYYLLSGERYYFIKDKTYHVKPGELVLINKYDVHYTANFDNKIYTRVLISFRDCYLSDILSSIGREDLLDCFKNEVDVIKFDTPTRSVVENILDAMISENNNRSSGYETYMKTLLIQLLLIVARECDVNKKGVAEIPHPPHLNISKIVGYINNNYNEDIDLKSISEMFYISPCHFSRSFKKTTGLSFVEYLNNVRIKEATKLLIKTKMNVTEICQAVGFKNNTHFGRVFKSITGLSPLTYRKNYRSL